MSRTTLDIDEELLAAAMAVSGLKTKTAVVEQALRTFLNQQAQLRLLEELGTFDLDLDQEQIERMRAGE